MPRMIPSVPAASRKKRAFSALAHDHDAAPTTDATIALLQKHMSNMSIYSVNGEYDDDDAQWSHVDAIRILHGFGFYACTDHPQPPKRIDEDMVIGAKMAHPHLAGEFVLAFHYGKDGARRAHFWRVVWHHPARQFSVRVASGLRGSVLRSAAKRALPRLYRQDDIDSGLSTSTSPFASEDDEEELLPVQI